jgi:hypothetical protein
MGDHATSDPQIGMNMALSNHQSSPTADEGAPLAQAIGTYVGGKRLANHQLVSWAA